MVYSDKLAYALSTGIYHYFDEQLYGSVVCASAHASTVHRSAQAVPISIGSTTLLSGRLFPDDIVSDLIT